MTVCVCDGALCGEYTLCCSVVLAKVGRVHMAHFNRTILYNLYNAPKSGRFGASRTQSSVECIVQGSTYYFSNSCGERDGESL
jgi:hypothetical protein